MSEWNKTYAFVAAALVCVGLAFASTVATRPAAPGGFERVGEPFYAEFDDPLAADSLRIVTYNDETSVVKTFEVARGEDGAYRISPYDYPADAEDRLADVAASLVGVERNALASRRPADHEKYGVIDPLTDDSSLLAGRGSRVTVSAADGSVLADYILGGEAEAGDGYRYVRRPDEKEVYLAALDVDLSSKFTDWVDADVLDVTAGDVRRVLIKDYKLDEAAGSILQRDELLLSREESFGDWSLDGLEEGAEEVDSSAVNDLVRNLNDLSILGVRPKPAGIRPDLSIDPEVVTNQLVLNSLVIDMQEKGFIVAQGESGGVELLGTDGQLSLGTEDGVTYDLYFGDLFTGSEYEIEVGGEADEETPAEETDPAEDSDGNDSDEDESDSKSLTDSRYIFVAARLDASLLGEEPTKPEPPAEAEANAEPEASDETDGDGGDGTDEESESESEESDAEDAESPQARYEAALADYETAKADYDAKVTGATEAVEALNERFGAWYYVVSAEDFKEVRLDRDAIVDPVEKDEAGADSASSDDAEAAPEAPSL